MKNLKRGGLVSIMTLVMVLTALVSSNLAYAEEKKEEKEGSIILIAEGYVCFDLFRIFDLTYSGEGENKLINYTIAEGWEEFFLGEVGSKYLIDEAKEGLNQVTMSDGQIKYINITEQNVEALSLDAISFAAHEEGDYYFHVQEVGPDKSVKIKLGYYLIYPIGATQEAGDYGTCFSLTTVAPEATIYAKGIIPTVKKEGDKNSACIGEAVKYTVTGVVPNTAPFENSDFLYCYKFKDKLSKNLILNEDSIKVYIAGEELNDNYTITINNNQTFEVQIYVSELQDKIGKEIKMTYEAAPDKNAAADPEGCKNKASLEYSRESFAIANKEIYTEEVTVYTKNITIDKRSENTGYYLEGAKFVLLNEKGQFYNMSQDGNKVSWVDDIEEATQMISDEKGFTEFRGLAFGEYRLRETLAPKGFNVLDEDKHITIDNDSELYTEIVVKNRKGYLLPNTGARGAMLFTVVGGCIVLFAGFKLIKKKVKKKDM